MLRQCVCISWRNQNPAPFGNDFRNPVHPARHNRHTRTHDIQKRGSQRLDQRRKCEKIKSGNPCDGVFNPTCKVHIGQTFSLPAEFFLQAATPQQNKLEIWRILLQGPCRLKQYGMSFLRAIHRSGVPDNEFARKLPL